MIKKKSMINMITDIPRDVTVTEAFMRMFVETCGHYDLYIARQQDGENIFQVWFITKP